MISGRPWPSHTACSFEFKPPFVRPIRLGTDPFLKGSRRCDGLSDGSRRSSAGAACQPCAPVRRNLVEHAKTAPAHEPIVDRLVRTVFARSIAPPQPVPDDEDDPANHPSVINLGTPCDSGKNGSIRHICASESRNNSVMATPPCAAIESTDHLIRKIFNGS